MVRVIIVSVDGLLRTSPMWMYSDASFGSMVYFDPARERDALQSAESYVKGVGAT